MNGFLILNEYFFLLKLQNKFYYTKVELIIRLKKIININNNYIFLFFILNTIYTYVVY